MDLKTMAIILLQNDCPRSKNDDGTIEYNISLCCIDYKIIVRPTEFSQTGMPLDYDVLSMDILSDEELEDKPSSFTPPIMDVVAERAKMYQTYKDNSIKLGNAPLPFDQWMVSRGFGYSSVDFRWVKI